MSLHTKYRPGKLDEVQGHDAVVRSIRTVLAKGTGRAFIFTGPAGTGKTTFGRVIANEVGCLPINLVEVDAAANSGVDSMRQITDAMRYKGTGGNPTRVVIVDEAHNLSKSAWDTMLKPVEEPPRHVWWVFCTTAAGKIPKTIVTRCNAYDLKPVPSDLIYKLLRRVNKAEALDTSDDVLDLIADKAGGSFRQALTCLSQCAGVTDKADAVQLIEDAGKETELGELMRELASGRAQWGKVMKIMQGLGDINAENARHAIFGYFTAIVRNSREGGNRARQALAVMEAFSQPYPQNAHVGYLLLSLGRLLLA